ncbi:MAG: hypothetical protein VX871_09255 [Pseudomonadota bacterium]|nr:hypothetical protein [Pseudomonadota bacterium]
MLASILRIAAVARLVAAARTSVTKGLRHVAVCFAAGLLFLAATVFATLAAYWSLLSLLTPVQAAGAMALALFAIGGLVLLLRPAAVDGEPLRSMDGEDDNPVEQAAMSVREGAGELTRNLGPLNVISLALLTGIAAGRKF